MFKKQLKSAGHVTETHSTFASSHSVTRFQAAESWSDWRTVTDDVVTASPHVPETSQTLFHHRVSCIQIISDSRDRGLWWSKTDRLQSASISVLPLFVHLMPSVINITVCHCACVCALVNARVRMCAETPNVHLPAQYVTSLCDIRPKTMANQRVNPPTQGQITRKIAIKKCTFWTLRHKNKMPTSPEMVYDFMFHMTSFAFSSIKPPESC